MSAIGARSPLASFGIWMLGPALLEFATEEQKKEHLPQIVRGEIWWCQGYSEPGQVRYNPGTTKFHLLLFEGDVLSFALQ